MITIFGDAESYYNSKQDYTLRRMTPIQYILDPRWETIGWSVIVDHSLPVWFPRDEFRDFLHEQDPAQVRFVSHNALFDACILAWRYNYHPRLLVDTMSMARALLSHTLPRGSVSLDNVGAFYGLQKGNTVKSVDGMNEAAIRAAGLYDGYVDYGLGDVTICKTIYDNLAPSFTAEEFVINDMIIRMATQPQFAVDQNKLHEHLATVQGAKESLLERIGLERKDLLSNDKFAAVLTSMGIDPPMKTSPVTGRQTYAFAKTDAAMTELVDYPDPDVQALIAARLGVKSTLEESRTQRFIDVAQVTHDGDSAWMPIALRYSGAHTHRFSGDWKLNQQNLPSRKNTSLRESLKAPDGHKIIAVDASQIEARLTAWLAGQQDLLEQFENKQDVYSIFASDIYGRPVTKADKVERFLGKTSVLGLGFGMGPPKFQNTVRIQAADQGIQIDVDIDEAARIVELYRWKNDRIAALWKWLNNQIRGLATGANAGLTFGPCVFEHEAIVLPSGLRLHYPDLVYENDNWSFTMRGKRTKTYGAKILENVVQALDRQAVMEAAIRIRQRALRELGIVINLAHQVHDELVYVVPIELVVPFYSIAEQEMSRRPVWGPGLPLASEVKSGDNYGQLSEVKFAA